MTEDGLDEDVLPRDVLALLASATASVRKLRAGRAAGTAGELRLASRSASASLDSGCSTPAAGRITTRATSPAPSGSTPGRREGRREAGRPRRPRRLGSLDRAAGDRPGNRGSSSTMRAPARRGTGSGGCSATRGRERVGLMRRQLPLWAEESGRSPPRSDVGRALRSLPRRSARDEGTRSSRPSTRSRRSSSTSRSSGGVHRRGVAFEARRQRADGRAVSNGRSSGRRGWSLPRRVACGRGREGPGSGRASRSSPTARAGVAPR
jgi:hypothetical protein